MLSTSFGTLASGQVVPGNWRQTFSDGFNRGTLNARRWNVATFPDTFGGGTRSNQVYQASRVRTGVSAAGQRVLQLTSGRSNGQIGGGRITSARRVFGNHGILRARIRLSSTFRDEYVWPTFWAVDTRINTDRAQRTSGELDIFEGMTLNTGVNFASHADRVVRVFGFYPNTNVVAWRTYGVRVNRGTTVPEFFIGTTRHSNAGNGDWNRRSRAEVVFSSSPNLTQTFNTFDNLPSMWVDYVTMHRPPRR